MATPNFYNKDGTFVSLESAASERGLSRAQIRDLVERGDVSSITVRGTTYVDRSGLRLSLKEVQITRNDLNNDRANRLPQDVSDQIRVRDLSQLTFRRSEFTEHDGSRVSSRWRVSKDANQPAAGRRVYKLPKVISISLSLLLFAAVTSVGVSGADTILNNISSNRAASIEAFENDRATTQTRREQGSNMIHRSGQTDNAFLEQIKNIPREMYERITSAF